MVQIVVMRTLNVVFCLPNKPFFGERRKHGRTLPLVDPPKTAWLLGFMGSQNSPYLPWMLVWNLFSSIWVCAAKQASKDDSCDTPVGVSVCPSVRCVLQVDVINCRNSRCQTAPMTSPFVLFILHFVHVCHPFHFRWCQERSRANIPVNAKSTLISSSLCALTHFFLLASFLPSRPPPATQWILHRSHCEVAFSHAPIEINSFFVSFHSFWEKDTHTSCLDSFWQRLFRCY